MSTAIQDQSWLNGHGAKLLVDGKRGPATRAAIIETFRHRSAPLATDAEIAAIAGAAGLNLRAMKALARVESGGAGWDASGLLACLYERHYLFRRIGLAWGMYSSATPGGYTVDADGDGINDSWEKLADASCRYGMETVFECASFGRFQIMGAHWRALGYASAPEFVWALSRAEAAHYDAFAGFIRANGLTSALNRVDGNPENCRAIAAGYNGKGYAAQAYHQKIADAWKVVG
jgi:hypothetical protein